MLVLIALAVGAVVIFGVGFFVGGHNAKQAAAIVAAANTAASDIKKVLP